MCASTRVARDIRACMLSSSQIFQIYEAIPFITIKETEKKKKIELRYEPPRMFARSRGRLTREVNPRFAR